MTLDITWPDKNQLKDHELLLWLFINGNIEYDVERELLRVDGNQLHCRRDALGLPDLDNVVRAAVRAYYSRLSVLQFSKFVNKQDKE